MGSTWRWVLLGVSLAACDDGAAAPRYPDAGHRDGGPGADAGATEDAGAFPDSGLPPFGGDATFELGWTVNGGGASEASCNALGADRVLLRMTSLGGDLYENTFPCWLGHVDSRPVPALGRGVYHGRLVPLAASGRAIVDSTKGSGSFSIDTTSVDHAVGTANLVGRGILSPAGTDATVAASWQLDGAPLDATACADLGIRNVKLVARTPGEAHEVELAVADCGAGTLSASVAYGSWDFVYTAFTPGIPGLGTGTTFAVSVPERIDVVAPATTAEVPPFALDTLRVALAWDGDPGPAFVPVTCGGETGPGPMTYELRDAGGTRVVAETEVYCEDRLTFGAVAGGTYELAVTAYRAGRTWATTCAMLVADGGIDDLACEVPRTDTPPP